ncbi:MAG: glycoside hydrolase [Bifidobacterium sp.]|nr:glycoside hydrolase [Bifidobacterium sp.]
MSLQASSRWNYTWYRPPNASEACDVHITRIVPEDAGFCVQWADVQDGETAASGKEPQRYCVGWRPLEDGGDAGELFVAGECCHVSGLRNGADYSVTVGRVSTGTSSDGVPNSNASGTPNETSDDALSSGSVSEPRLVRCGQMVGSVVDYLHPKDDAFRFSGQYLASPSIAKLPSGALMVSMDVFTWRGAQNLTLLFVSQDEGRTWNFVTELMPCLWGRLFMHDGSLYMLGMSCEYGDLLIGRSTDEGRTWSTPTVLFRGSGNADVGGFHKAPMPVVHVGSRLVTGVDYGSWETGFANSLLVADATGDLLDPCVWRLSQLCTADQRPQELRHVAALEGNAVVGPDGVMRNMLRLQMDGSEPRFGKALMLKATGPDCAGLRFEGLSDFNGGSNSKFEIVYDELSKTYLALANEITDPDLPTARNILSLMVSRDLKTFRTAARVVDLSDCDPAWVAAQYPSFIVDNDDLLVVSRTAMNGADSYHNSNAITFHGVKDFRALL